MGRKMTPSVSASAARTHSTADAGAPPEREPQEPMTKADRAYAHAVEVCERIVRELEGQLPANYHKEG